LVLELKVDPTETEKDRLVGQALGLEPFQEKFYGVRCLLAETIKRVAPRGPAMSIAEARSHLYLEEWAVGTP
jgi:hypothetical protein